MKIFFALVFSVFAYSFAGAQAYKITLSAPQYNGGLAYLTYYYGKNMNVQDSAIVNAKGVAVFSGAKKNMLLKKFSPLICSRIHITLNPLHCSRSKRLFLLF